MGKKQTEIPGTERQQIQEIDDAAEAYQDAKKKRMKLTEKESEAKIALISVLRKNKVDVYRDDNASPPLLFTLKPGKDGVTVSEVENETDDSAEEVEEVGEDYQ
jgi:hypothetical protein